MRFIIHFNKRVFGQISRTVDCESYNMTDHAFEVIYNNEEFVLFPLINIESIQYIPTPNREIAVLK